MRGYAIVIAVLVLAVSLTGCGLRTYVVEKERVDQEVSGNQGVLMGDAPEAAQPATPPTRKLIAVDVELPAFTGPAKKTEERRPSKPSWQETPDRELWGNRGILSADYVAEEEPQYPYEAERAEEVKVIAKPRVEPPEPPKKAYEPVISRPKPKPVAEAQKPKFSQYTVKKGDTLSSIAAKPQIYGSARKWKRIYEANRDILKDSSRIYPGQVLKIPRGGEEEEARRSSDIK